FGGIRTELHVAQHAPSRFSRFGEADLWIGAKRVSHLTAPNTGLDEPCHSSSGRHSHAEPSEQLVADVDTPNGWRSHGLDQTSGELFSHAASLISRIQIVSPAVLVRSY